MKKKKVALRDMSGLFPAAEHRKQKLVCRYIWPREHLLSGSLQETRNFFQSQFYLNISA